MYFVEVHKNNESEDFQVGVAYIVKIREKMVHIGDESVPVFLMFYVSQESLYSSLMVEGEWGYAGCSWEGVVDKGDLKCVGITRVDELESTPVSIRDLEHEILTNSEICLNKTLTIDELRELWVSYDFITPEDSAGKGGGKF